MDGKPTHLFFLLMAPENSIGLHLKALAKISRMLKDSSFRRRFNGSQRCRRNYEVACCRRYRTIGEVFVFKHRGRLYLPPCNISLATLPLISTMNNYPENQETFPVLIITGLSGSGKSTALRALEDIGYFCIDNLPIHLVPKFLELRAQITQEDVKVAFGMDVRTRGFVENYMNFFPTVAQVWVSITYPFFGGQRRNLNQTVQPDPRQHPLAENESIVQAIQKERAELNSLKNHATRIIDTSNMTVHNLRLSIMEEYSQLPLSRRLQLHIISFGFKYGLPPEADITMDVRFLPNPFFIKDLKEVKWH